MSSQSIKPGTRVRVSFEGTVTRGPESGSFLVEFSNSMGANHGYFSRENIEVLSPPFPDEPKLFGALVRVDGRLWTRADDDNKPWFNKSLWRSWEHLTGNATDVTVLFEGAE